MRYRKDNKYEHRNLVIFNYIDYNPAKFIFEKRFFINDMMEKLELFAYKIQNKIDDRDTLNLIITDLINSFCYTKSSSMNIEFKLIGEKPERYCITCDDFGYTVNDYWKDISFGSSPNIPVENMPPERVENRIKELQKIYPNVDFVHMMIYTIRIEKIQK